MNFYWSLKQNWRIFIGGNSRLPFSSSFQSRISLGKVRRIKMYWIKVILTCAKKNHWFPRESIRSKTKLLVKFSNDLSRLLGYFQFLLAKQSSDYAIFTSFHANTKDFSFPFYLPEYIHICIVYNYVESTTDVMYEFVHWHRASTPSQL